MLRAFCTRILTALIVLLLIVASIPAYAASSGLVISQVYGGGGNSGAPLTNDFIEIFNRGASSISLNGLSVQYTSATGVGNLGASGLITVLPNATLAPGQYFLIQEAGAAGGALSAPDATGSINMSATGGKVALVASAASVGCNGGSTPCSPAQLSQIVDLIGYDGANFFEGSSAPTLSNTTAALRKSGGCIDTDNNGADFASGTPTPRNTASTLNLCGQPLPPTGSGSASPSAIVAGDSTLLTVTVTAGSNPGSTGIAVVADLTGIGGAAAQTFFDDGTNGDLIANDNVFSFQISIGASTTAGSITLPFTVSDAQFRSSTGNIGISITRPPDVLNIHAIQGPGVKSPFDGDFVQTMGVVTAVKSNGFFIQNPDGQDDGDPNTSEGVFIFTSSKPASAAALGNLVQVRGTVAEFRSLTDPLSFTSTEISGSVQVTLLSTGNPLPSPVTLTAADTDPHGGAQELEKYQGMRVLVPSLSVVAPTQGNVNETNATATSNGVFFGVIAGVARPFREAGIQDPENLLFPPPPCCIPVFDGNPEHIRVDSDAQVGANPIDVTSGALVTNLTGVLDYLTHEYTIIPDPASPPAVSGNVAAMPLPAPDQHEITIVGMNVERFFDTVNDPGTSDAVLTPTAFANRLNKASLIIRNILNMPDIVGVEEMENLSTLQAVAAKVNSDAVAAGLDNPGYAAYLDEGNDVGGIDVGFLVKTSRISVDDVTQYGKDTQFVQPDGNSALLNDRPPLVLHAKVIATGKELPLSFTVIANHLRSLDSIDDPADGPRVRAKRLAQAHDLANLIQGFQAGGENVVSLGDYNALSVNDGFVDIMGIILGTPAPADQDVLGDGTSPVSPPLTDLLTTLPADRQYSYSFDGDAQILDHILVSDSIKNSVSRFVYAHDDADFPETFRNDPNRPERLSDHDQAVAYFTVPTDTVPPVITLPAQITVEAASPAGAAVVTWAVSAVDAVDGPTTVTCDNTSGATYPLGATLVSCSSTDSHGNTATGSFTINVVDTTPPVVSVTGVTNGANYVLGAVPAAGCTTTDSVSGVAVFAVIAVSGGTANSVGSFTATWSGAKDKAGNTAPAVRATYSVGYLFNGFFSPLGAGISGPFQTGSTVPLKWQVKNANGAFISSVSAIQSVQMAYNGSCAGNSEDAPVVADSPGSSGLRYDAGSNVFLFNWKTPKGAPAGCYSIGIVLDDGSTHSAIVVLK
jgi:uncharacterized protein